MARLFALTDIASLVFFRLAFGAVMLWEIWRYWQNGWIAAYWIEPQFHFKYYGFGWVHPWGGQGMYVHFVALGLLAFCILIGFCYRLAALLFFLGFSYVFFLEQARYLNHFYLLSLLSFLLIFVPANRSLSLDAWLWPFLRSQTMPVWCLWLLQTQIGIAYFYAGLAKLNEDWLQSQPMSIWLADHTEMPLLGPYMRQPWVAYFFSYSGLLLDLFVVPFLLWRRTRPYAFCAILGFHLLNNQLFTIGIFPWFMLAATTLFFSPSWPRVLLSRLWPRKTAFESTVEPAVASNAFPDPTSAPAQVPNLTLAGKATLALLSLYVVGQFLIPLRHFLYPGEVSWTEEGHRFSWHMKLRTKESTATFFVTDPQRRQSWRIVPDTLLTKWQMDKMPKRPDMILQFAHYLAEKARREGHEQVEVRAEVWCGLNGRKPQLLIDPKVDLAKQPRSLLPASWILPLKAD